MQISDTDIADIERATAVAVPPSAWGNLASFAQWLLPLDSGTVGRAHSAVPLNHTSPDLACIAAIESVYEASGLGPAWRLPQVPRFDGIRAALHQRGYGCGQPTWVQVAELRDVLQAAPAARPMQRIELHNLPVSAWQSVYLGPGFDAADGASRIEILGRSRSTVFAVGLSDAEQAVASGALSLYADQGQTKWASIHGMRTAPEQRGQGWAIAIVRSLAEHARAHGFERIFLQVEQGNTQAQRLYARLGFSNAWGYDYWRLPKARGGC